MSLRLTMQVEGHVGADGRALLEFIALVLRVLAAYAFFALLSLCAASARLPSRRGTYPRPAEPAQTFASCCSSGLTRLVLAPPLAGSSLTYLATGQIASSDDDWKDPGAYTPNLTVTTHALLSLRAGGLIHPPPSHPSCRVPCERLAAWQPRPRQPARQRLARVVLPRRRLVQRPLQLRALPDRAPRRRGSQPAPVEPSDPLRRLRLARSCRPLLADPPRPLRLLAHAPFARPTHWNRCDRIVSQTIWMLRRSWLRLIDAQQRRMRNADDVCLRTVLVRTTSPKHTRPMSKARPIWPASLSRAHVADWPRTAEPGACICH